MAKTKKAEVVNRISGNGQTESAMPTGSSAVKLKPMNIGKVQLRIVGTSPLVQHQWAEKAKEMMRQKHAGKKTKNRDIRDTEQEGKDAMYLTDDGHPGIPAAGFRNCLIGAAHKDIGIEKTLVKKAVFVLSKSKNNVIPIQYSEVEIREDLVRVGMGSADLRYRPYFYDWSVDLLIQLDCDLMTIDDLVNLIDRAGFGVGLCEWRPEKSGEYGRFEVDRTFPVAFVD